MRNSRKMWTMAVAGMLGMAGLAQGQVVVTAASGLAKATAGNGSGSNQQVSSNTSGFNLTATKNFTNGHATASTSYGLSNWKLSGSFSIASFAPTQGEAGSAETDVLVTMTAPEDLDLEYSGGYSANSPFASITQELRKTSNNSYVVGGNSPNQVHILAGQYQLTIDSFLNYGDASGGFNIQFRPGNDRCQFARLVGNGTFTGDTTYATADGTPSCGNNTSAKSVWYKYVAPRTGALRVDTCGSFFDTVLSVYDTTSCPSGTGTEIGCNDDAPGGLGCGLRQSLLNLNVSQGQTYYIRVAGYNGAAGDYELNIGPVNDECESATVVGPGAYPFDNTMANTDGPVLNSCVILGDTQVNGDLWWEYTPAQAGYMSVDTCGSAFDTKLAVYINAPCAGRSTYVACSDDACGTGSRIDDIPVVAGLHYFIRVGGYKTNRGTGTLHISYAPPCPADFNGDGAVDFFDYDDFVQCFEGGACPPGKTADFNGDTAVDFFDYDDFVVAFETPCP